jgi:hypothetical protein
VTIWMRGAEELTPDGIARGGFRQAQETGFPQLFS